MKDMCYPRYLTDWQDIFVSQNSTGYTQFHNESNYFRCIFHSGLIIWVPEYPRTITWRRKNYTMRRHTNMNGDKRSPTSGHWADDGMLAIENPAIGCLRQGIKRLIHKRSPYIEILEMHQGLLVSSWNSSIASKLVPALSPWRHSSMLLYTWRTFNRGVVQVGTAAYIIVPALSTWRLIMLFRLCTWRSAIDHHIGNPEQAI